MRDPVLVLRFGQDHHPDVPQSVDRHPDDRRSCDAPLLDTCNVLLTVLVLTHLFKADVCDFPQDSFHRVCPLPFTQRILLSPDDVEIVRDVICRVIACLPLALTLKPRVDVVGRTGVSCRFTKTSSFTLHLNEFEFMTDNDKHRYPYSRCQ